MGKRICVCVCVCVLNIFSFPYIYSRSHRGSLRFCHCNHLVLYQSLPSQAGYEEYSNTRLW